MSARFYPLVKADDYWLPGEIKRYRCLFDDARRELTHRHSVGAALAREAATDLRQLFQNASRACVYSA